MKSEGEANRILMTADTIGGVWTYAIDLSRSLCRRGARITLAAMGAEPSKSQLDEVASIAGLQLEARPYKLEWMEDPWKRYRDLVRRSLQASDIVVAPSKTMLRALQKHYGPLERTQYIYNGRSPDDFLPAMADRYMQLYRELCASAACGPTTLATRGGQH